jgi:ribonuclease Y
MDSLVYIIVGVVVGAGGVGAFMLLQRQWQRQTLASAEEIAKLIIEEAKKEGTVLKKEAEVQAKDVILQARTDLKEKRETANEMYSNLRDDYRAEKKH